MIFLACYHDSPFHGSRSAVYRFFYVTPASCKIKFLIKGKKKVMLSRTLQLVHFNEC